MPHVPATAAPRRGPGGAASDEHLGSDVEVGHLERVVLDEPRRGSTTSPIRVLKIWSAATASSIRTLQQAPGLGLTVVSHSCSGFISPRPLKRWI